MSSTSLVSTHSSDFLIQISHRRRSSVNFRGAQHFCPKICKKIYQNARILHGSCPKNYQNTRIFIFARKINKIPKFYMIFAGKMPKFYIIIARKIFFSRIWGGGRASRPPSPTPMKFQAFSSIISSRIGVGKPVYKTLVPSKLQSGTRQCGSG